MTEIGETLILNGDDKTDLKYGSDFTGLVVTCGFEPHSSVTASSIKENGFTYCLRRSIFTINNCKVEPQEFGINWLKKPDDMYGYLIFITTLLVLGISPKELSRFKF